MPVKGMDISNHQAGMDVERIVRENDFGFVFILTNDGTFVNKHFHAQADAAERAGAIVLPYVYLRPNWAQTIDIHLGIVKDRYKQSIVDVEEGSGDWDEVWAAHNRLWDNDQDTPLLYWPNFHWQAMGSPDLSPLAERVKAHWKSWYPDKNWDWFDDAWKKVPTYPWNDNRGGIPVAILQFTGTGRVNGYGSHVDFNLFTGSREELNDLLGGVDDMGLNNDQVTALLEGAAAVRSGVSGKRDAGELFLLEYENGLRLQRIEAQNAELLGRPAADIDEGALAAELLRLGLGRELGKLPEEQLVLLAKTVNDEADRRERARANVNVPPADKSL